MLSSNADVPCGESVALEQEVSVGVVDGSAVERIAYRLPPVLPAWFNVVVVVIVFAANVVGELGCAVGIDRTALVTRIDIF